MSGIGSQLLDVALGLTFIFLALSLVCSVFQELIATALSWRAEGLERGIRRMLCDPTEPKARLGRVDQALKALKSMVGRPTRADNPPTGHQPRDDDDRTEVDQHFLSDKLLESPFIREKLGRNLLTARRAVPSYLSSRTFALALFDTLTRDVPAPRPASEGATDAVEHDAKADDARGTAELQTNEDLIVKVEAGLEHVPHAGVRRQLQLMLADAEGDLARFHDRVEMWFDDTMARASGWYRRRTQLVLFVVGLGVAAGVNADTFDLTGRLWTDAPVRAALVQQATQTARVENLDKLEAELEKRGGKLEAVKQFKLPLGWNADNGRPSDLGFGKGKENLLGWLAGILVAAAALSFGAPFWFDALNKVGRLRIAGHPPKSGG
jgi:hypothetical protein